MAKRTGMSKRLRFEVFKRDGFRCVYCGATPMVSVMHVDHVVAVANGGTNDPANLVTACADCNGGKSSVPLEQRKLTSGGLSAEEAVERAEQVKAYLAAQKDIIATKDEAFAIVTRAWEEASGFTHSKQEVASLRRFVEKLGIEAVIAAIHIACTNKPCSTAYQSTETFRYFCGICWKEIRKAKELVAVAEEPAKLTLYTGWNGQPATWSSVFAYGAAQEARELLAERGSLVLVVRGRAELTIPDHLANSGPDQPAFSFFPLKQGEAWFDQQAIRFIDADEPEGLVSVAWNEVAAFSAAATKMSDEYSEGWLIQPRSPEAELVPSSLRFREAYL